MTLSLQLLIMVCFFQLTIQKISGNKDDQISANTLSREHSASDFILVVDDKNVFGVVDVPFNFTVRIADVKWNGKPIEALNYLLLELSLNMFCLYF